MNTKIRHLRLHEISNKGDKQRSNHGGATIAYHGLDGNSHVEFAVAFCNQKDNYSRKIGTSCVTGRMQQSHSLIMSGTSVEEFEDLLDFISNSEPMSNMSLATLLKDKLGADMPRALRD